MKVKAENLTGSALDWAVWKAWKPSPVQGLTAYGKGLWYGDVENSYLYEWYPSLNWAQGGPIIEREKMTIDYFGDGSYPNGGIWMATYFRDTPDGTHMNTCEQEGPTALVAAMRCYVAARLGDEVEVPDEIVQEITS